MVARPSSSTTDFTLPESTSSASELVVKLNDHLGPGRPSRSRPRTTEPPMRRVLRLGEAKRAASPDGELASDFAYGDLDSLRSRRY